MVRVLEREQPVLPHRQSRVMRVGEAAQRGEVCAAVRVPVTVCQEATDRLPHGAGHFEVGGRDRDLWFQQSGADEPRPGGVGVIEQVRLLLEVKSVDERLYEQQGLGRRLGLWARIPGGKGRDSPSIRPRDRLFDLTG